MTSRGRVLIVDDEPDFTEVVKWQLENLHYDVIAENTGEDAVRRLNETGFDVLIADVRMPGMDGIELIKRALTISPDIQCIVITGHGDVDTAIEAMRAGAVNYLRKPAGIEELDIAISKAMDTLRLIHETRAQQVELENNNRELRALRKQLEELLAEEKTQREKAESALKERLLREALVEVLSLSLRLWKQTTRRDKVDFAEESKVWTASVDSNGTYRTRTLDKYLRLDSLPPNPRYGDVLDSAYFAISQCSVQTDIKKKLEDRVSELEKLLM